MVFPIAETLVWANYIYILYIYTVYIIIHQKKFKFGDIGTWAPYIKPLNHDFSEASEKITQFGETKGPISCTAHCQGCTSSWWWIYWDLWMFIPSKICQNDIYIYIYICGLYCAVIYCTIYSTVLCYILLLWDYILLLRTIFYCYVLYSTVMYYILLLCTISLCTILYCYVLALVLIHSHIYVAVTIGLWTPRSPHQPCLCPHCCYLYLLLTECQVKRQVKTMAKSIMTILKPASWILLFAQSLCCCQILIFWWEKKNAS